MYRCRFMCIRLLGAWPKMLIFLGCPRYCGKQSFEVCVIGGFVIHGVVQNGLESLRSMFLFLSCMSTQLNTSLA